MRIKNDMVIKYYQEQQLASLTYEEIGLLFFLLFKLQDTEEKRFENTTDYMAKIILDRESEVERKRREMAPERKVIFETALATICGQAENSKSAFNRLQNQLNEKSDKGKTVEKVETEESKEIDTTTAEWSAVKSMIIKNGIDEKEYENVVKYDIIKIVYNKGITPFQAAQEIIKEYQKYI